MGCPTVIHPLIFQRGRFNTLGMLEHLLQHTESECPWPPRQALGSTRALQRHLQRGEGVAIST